MLFFMTYRCVRSSLLDLLRTGAICKSYSSAQVSLVLEGLEIKRAVQIAIADTVTINDSKRESAKNLAILQCHLGEKLYSDVNDTVAWLESIRARINNKEKRGTNMEEWPTAIKDVYHEYDRSTGGLRRQYILARQGKTVLATSRENVGCNIPVKEWQGLVTTARAKILAYRNHCNGNA